MRALNRNLEEFPGNQKTGGQAAGADGKQVPRFARDDN